VFIEAKNRYYTFERVPKFWSFLAKEVDDGSICCPKAVFDELMVYKDKLSEWVRNRKDKGLCTAASPQIQQQMTLIADFVANRYTRAKSEEFLSAADPWVVATALHCGGTVVTQESSSAKKKVRIPSVCQQFQIRCVDTFEMLDHFNAKF